MVARASGYYGDPFQGSRGVIQGGLLSHQIFNVIVDMFFYHWFGLVAEETFFYADDGIVASTNPVWI